MPETVATGARRTVRVLARRFFARADGALALGRDADLHAARIAGKRLRYTLEFFAPQFAPAGATALGLLTHLQDVLGAIADSDTFLATYEALLAPLEQDDPRVPGLLALRRRALEFRASRIAAARGLWKGARYAPYPEMLAASLWAALGSISPPSP